MGNDLWKIMIPRDPGGDSGGIIQDIANSMFTFVSSFCAANFGKFGPVHPPTSICRDFVHPANRSVVLLTGGGGALNFGLRAKCHQKDPTFFSLAFTERPLFLPTFT